MTIVYVVSSGGRQKLTAYSDSRVLGGNLKLDSAAKLLVLPICARLPNDTINHTSSYGFAFCGSTLLAQSLYSFVSCSLQSLRSEVGSSPPSVEDIALFVGNSFENLFVELGSNGRPYPKLKTGIFIFGFCHATKACRLIRLETVVEDGTATVGILEHDVSIGDTAWGLGDEASFREYVRANDLDPQNLCDNLELAIDDDQLETIGGELQILQADTFGARAVPTLHRSSNGRAKCRMLNQVLDGQKVGHYHFLHKAIGRGL